MVKVIAVICHLATHACQEITVTTSELSGVTLGACQVAQPQLADFMRQYPAYRLAAWKCQIGNRGNHV